MSYRYLHGEPVAETDEGVLRFDADTGGVYVDEQPAHDAQDMEGEVTRT